MRKPFLTPPTTPAEVQCRSLQIPMSKYWLGIFNSALLEATYAYNYEQVNDTDLTPEQAANAALEIFSAYLDSTCGGTPSECTTPGTDTPPFRIGAGGHLQQAVDGEWVAPEGIYELPPVPPRTNPSEVDRICLAAANAAKTLSDTYEAMIDAYNEDLDPSFGLAQLAGTTGAAIAVGLGYISFGLGTIIFGVFQLFYEAFQWLTTDSWDAAFTDKVVCYLIECASDDAGVVTFDYDCFMQKVSADSNLTEDLTDIRRFGQIWYMMQFIGVEGLNLAGATTSITTPECECDDGWCYTWDFAASPSAAGWTLSNTTYVLGTGYRVAGISSAPNFRDARIYRALPAGDYVCTRMEAVLYSSPAGPGHSRFIFTTNGNSGNGGTGGPSTIAVNANNEAGDAVEAYFGSGGTGANSDSYCASITLYGTGTNPFGADNCP